MTTMLITSYLRDALFSKTLKSIRDYSDIDILILDDANSSITRRLADKFGCRYLCTREEGTSWRMPGYALNIGIQETDSENIIITTEDVLHKNDCVNPIIALIKPKAIVNTRGQYEKTPGEFVPLKTQYHFLVGIKRKELIDIGGFDEDFTGVGFDDADLMDRLTGNGCFYLTADADCVHQYHSRTCHQVKGQESNQRIYTERKGTIIRNVGKKWGQAC